MATNQPDPKKARKLAKRDARQAAAAAKAERTAKWEAGRTSPATADLVTPPAFGYDEWLDSDHDFEAFGAPFWVERGPDIKTPHGMMQGASDPEQDAWSSGFRGELRAHTGTAHTPERASALRQSRVRQELRAAGKVVSDYAPPSSGLVETRSVMLLMSRTNKKGDKVFQFVAHTFALDTPDELDPAKQQWSSGFIRRSTTELDQLDVQYAEYLISRQTA